MDSANLDDPALPLVHQGWDHLKRQRPLAAWATWRRALAVSPELKAATQALHVLTNAADLPAIARREFRLLPPANETDRQRWDVKLRARGLDDLGLAAEAFRALADEQPNDTAARFNEALCLAWSGRNVEALAAIDRRLRVLPVATSEEVRDAAIESWTLAEVLRQGGGAESLADDLSHAAFTNWPEPIGPFDDPGRFLDDLPNVRPVPPPLDPVTNLPRLPEASIYEWLDAAPDGRTPRRVLAHVVRQPRSIRVSGPDLAAIEDVIAIVTARLGPGVDPLRREATPRPLAFLDADVWAVRMPDGLDEESLSSAHRAVVERYYEKVWIHQKRRGLDGRSPLEAAQAAVNGDWVARVKLLGVIALREELSRRPSAASLYQGYPFDRLRRRLGLAPLNPDAVDPNDATSMSAAELDAVDEKTLDPSALLDAFESAATLGDDSRASRFAEAFVRHGHEALQLVDRKALFATLVRSALVAEDVEKALGWIDQAIAADEALSEGRGRGMYQTWRAEVHARNDRPDLAVAIYEQQLRDEPNDPGLALDAAETLVDNGYNDQAIPFVRNALSLAAVVGDEDVGQRAEALLDSLGASLP